MKNGNKMKFIEKALRYAKAVSLWIEGGFHVRTTKEIQEIYENYCSMCESFDEEKSTCNTCGCHVNLSPLALFNKIAMKNQYCPQKKWGDGTTSDE